MEVAHTAARQVIDPSTKPIWIGRGPGVDVVLQDPKVVRKHALLLRISGMLQLSDRSDGLTFVNGRQISEAVLRDGDLVVLGGEQFSVESGKLIGLVGGEGFALQADKLTVDVQASGKTIRLLDNASITIESGQFVGLLGPSGAGKTTLLRCLVGYTKPTSGLIRAGRLELPDQAACFWPQAGFVPQHDILFLSLTARENLDFALQLRAPSLDRRERLELIDQRLSQLGLGERADNPLENLSGGERKRVSVAIETLSKPRVLFLDEPTAGLDPANETHIMQELRQLAKSGTTVVCATHILENVQRLHRAIFLVEGRVAYDGPPSGLLNHFHVKTYPELYEPKTLASGCSIAAGSKVVPLKPSGPMELPSTIELYQQIRVQLARGIVLLLRDRGWALMLLAQPILIAFLINLSLAEFTRVQTVYTFAAVSAVWLGLNNTARELVRERRHYVRERLLGVTPAGYLGAKVLLFAALGAGQVALLVGITRYWNFCDANRHNLLAETGVLLEFLVLWGAYLASALLGLFVSALAKTQEWAVALLPMIVLPQLLLTGEAADMHRSGRFQSLVYLWDHRGQRYQRTRPEWAVETVSLATFSRPCVALLSPPFEPDGDDRANQPSKLLASAINFVHMVSAIVLSGGALWFIFRFRDRVWLRTLT